MKQKIVWVLICFMVGILNVNAECYYGENEVYVEEQTICLGIKINDAEELLKENEYTADYQNNSFNIMINDKAIEKYVGNNSNFSISFSAYLPSPDIRSFSTSTKNKAINTMFLVDPRVYLFEERHQINSIYSIIKSENTYYFYENSSCIDHENENSPFEKCNLIFETTPVFQARYNDPNDKTEQELVKKDENNNYLWIIGISILAVSTAGIIITIIILKNKKASSISE